MNVLRSAWRWFVPAAIGVYLVLVSPLADLAHSVDEQHPTANAMEKLGGHDEASAHDVGDHGDPKPLFIGPDLAIVTAAIFVLLLVVLTKFAWKPIVAALELREKNISDHIAAAEREREDAKQLLVDYEAKLATAADQVRDLLEEARRDAEHTKSEIIAEARLAAQAEHKRAVREITNAKDGVLKELAERSADLAVDLAGRIVDEKLNPTDHARLIREAVAEFSNN